LNKNKGKQMIKYKNPKIKLLNYSGIGVAEYAARTCYDSFDKSENQAIREKNIYDLKDIENSKLLYNLAWVHFHHSILEHINFTFEIKGIPRGVLQELSRHRLASYSVKSTRYTLNDIAYIFCISHYAREQDNKFWDLEMNNIMSDIFTTKQGFINSENIDFIYMSLSNAFAFNELGYKDLLSKEQINILENYEYSNSKKLIEMQKAKKFKKCGDNIKFIVTDNFATDVLWSINLRSLKNFLQLRDSNSAWYPMQQLAKEIKKVTPIESLRLICKEYKDK
jgi:thymidylate synthase (FAD)